MRIGYLLGIIIFLFSCKEAPIVVPPASEDEIPVVVEVDSAYDIKLVLDGGFIISGTTYYQNNTDGWLIKTDSHGNFKGMLEYP